jgi:hypothetical protein
MKWDVILDTNILSHLSPLGSRKVRWSTVTATLDYNRESLGFHDSSQLSIEKHEYRSRRRSGGGTSPSPLCSDPGTIKLAN